MFFQKMCLTNRTEISPLFIYFGYAKNWSYRSQRSHTFYVTHVTLVTKFPYTVKKNLCLEHEKTGEFSSWLCARQSTTLLVNNEKLSDLNVVFTFLGIRKFMIILQVISKINYFHKNLNFSRAYVPAVTWRLL